ncbi:9912_t:CDS:2 [Ambispora leptoticha]|uniref:9912_t:CDS:1 n=1 Tax=Ambispora leptoticha TaxID=144679 RepID=A0A9N9GWE8_9GLOM|nr:9912_t:CDS:2 [Ambispora leptoticha]
MPLPAQTIREHPYHKTTSNDERSSGCNSITSPVTVVDANLDTSGEREIVVTLNDGVKIEFHFPTSKEIRYRFFYRTAKSSDKPDRPPNKFFIFRTMFQGTLDTFKLQVPIVSDNKVKEAFSKLAEIAKNEHSKINPDYIYKQYRKVSLAKSDLSSPSCEEESSETSRSPPSPTTPSPSWSNTYTNRLSCRLYAKLLFCQSIGKLRISDDVYCNCAQNDAIFQTRSTLIPIIKLHHDACYTSICPTQSPFLSYTPPAYNIRMINLSKFEHLQEVKIETSIALSN